MKEETKIVRKVVAKTAYIFAEKQANSVCMILFHQPKVPDKVRKLRKF